MTTITNHSDYITLVNHLHTLDHQYYTLNRPTVSDTEYDRLYFLAQDYEQRTGDILPDSPTQSAHGEVKNGHRQILRRTPMLSTEKAQTIDKVQKWMKATTKKTNEQLYTIEWKYDGVSCSLVYIDGKLTEASYGKGTTGNDCLALCQQVSSIPNTISASGRVEVRGEMVVPFAKLAMTGYKNCRSAAAGIMADTTAQGAECLEFIAYYINGNVKSGYHDFTSDLMDLDNYGFNLGYYYDVASVQSVRSYVECTADNLERVIERLTNYRDRYEIPTDGLVIKVKDCKKWTTLGQTAHHYKYAIAYKFPAATAETTITHIQITTGTTGRRTPVAHFEPVVINGATYQKASLGSEAKLAELNLTPGTHVLVSLRNDVIPHIEQVLTATNNADADTTPADTHNAVNNPGDPIAALPQTSDLRPSTSDLRPSTSDLQPQTTPLDNYLPSEPQDLPVIDSLINHPHATDDHADIRPGSTYWTDQLTARAHSPRHIATTIIATISAITLCLAGLAAIGAAVFLTPLLAGALLKA